MNTKIVFKTVSMTLVSCTLVSAYETSQTGMARLNRIRSTLAQITQRVKEKQSQPEQYSSSSYDRAYSTPQNSRAQMNNVSDQSYNQSYTEGPKYQSTAPLSSQDGKAWSSSATQNSRASVSSNPFYDAPVSASTHVRSGESLPAQVHPAQAAKNRVPAMHTPSSHSNSGNRESNTAQVKPMQQAYAPQASVASPSKAHSRPAQSHDSGSEKVNTVINTKVIDRLDKCQTIAPYLDAKGEKGEKAQSLYERFCFDLVEDLALVHNLDSFYAVHGKFLANKGRHVDANRYFTRLYQLFPEQLESNLLYIRNLNDLGQNKMASEMLGFIQSQFATRSLSQEEHTKLTELAHFVDMSRQSP